MRNKKIKNIVRKMNFLSDSSLEILNEIGDLCIREQENKRNNNNQNLNNIPKVNQLS